jgi:hypothetical protein
VPCPSRVLCESAGLLADIAAGNHRIDAKLLTTARGLARFNLDPAFFSGSIVPGTAPGPKGGRGVFIQFAGDNLLEHLQHNGQVASLRFAQQQMHVFGHDEISLCELSL